jgi:membrane protease YdiL (CAAX protease family)
MGNSKRLFYGLVITAVIFVMANIIEVHFHLHTRFIVDSFTIDTVMILLSVLIIIVLRENIRYTISLPKLKYVFRPILFGIVVSLVFNILMTVVAHFSGNKEGHFLIFNMSPVQVFLFVFIYASIAEEILFRGFLLNILKPLKVKGISCFKRRISLPVIISALVFGLAHLILITTGAGIVFLVMIVLSTTCLGLVAGYYQEKYDNNTYAIIVHMAGNSIPLLGILLMYASHS